MQDCQRLMDLARQQGYDRAQKEHALAEIRRLDRSTHRMQVFAIVLLAVCLGFVAYRFLT